MGRGLEAGAPAGAVEPAADSAAAGPRRGGRRDRRGRGMRGPAVVPGPLTPSGGPRRPSRRDRFDAQVLEVIEALEERWADELGRMVLAVEEAPVLPEGWDDSTVPLASVVRRGEEVRLVVFRRPIELRATTPEDLSALILTVVVEQVAELLGRAPHEVDPRYDEPDD